MKYWITIENQANDLGKIKYRLKARITIENGKIEALRHINNKTLKQLQPYTHKKLQAYNKPQTWLKTWTYNKLI